MLSWIHSNQEKKSTLETANSEIPIATSSSAIPQHVSKITVEIPSHKIETADFYVGDEVDVEAMGFEGSGSDNIDYIPPNFSRPLPNSQSNHNSIIGWSIEPISSLDDDNDDKHSFSHRLFNSITEHAGSRFVLLATIILIIVWALVGATFGPTDIWQIAMQNASSVQVYLTDILLIRQQHTSSRHLLTILSKMQSREQAYTRMIQKLSYLEPSSEFKESAFLESIKPTSLATYVPVQKDSSRSKEIFDESCRIIAGGLGSVWAYIIYWICIFCWVGSGGMFNYADTWQLYINTAVAVTLTFTSIFLQNRQQQQEDTLDRALKYITKVDAEIEFRLRTATGDEQTNDVVVIDTPKAGWINRGNDLFALMMGSFVGVVITVGFSITWLIIGPLLKYSADWWLILGTFTGLIGFLDGFVLRNVYAREAEIVNRELENSTATTSEVLAHLGLKHSEEKEKKLPLSSRISRTVGDWCATPTVSLISLLFVIALLSIATAMHWTTTGQLLCNTPTMIIEGFLLLVLIEAHCISDEVKGRHLKNILQRRLLFNRYLRESMVKVESTKEKCEVAVAEARKSFSSSTCGSDCSRNSVDLTNHESG